MHHVSYIFPTFTAEIKMMMTKKNTMVDILCLMAGLLAACHDGKTAKTLRSAYYWSTTWDMDSCKTAFIRQHHISRMYVRYFDVVKDEESGAAMPNATILFRTPVPEGIGIVPVVFIVNDCMRNCTQEDCRLLAEKIFRRIGQMNAANDIKGVKEIQIDCDWTASTQKAYFCFLNKLREMAKAKSMLVSATIRLHQLSIAPPPVDRGVLMMYNTGDHKLLSCHKPILDMKDAAPYIQHLGSYPLPLAAAYPLFKWRILFREGKFVGIMHADEDFPVLPGDSIVTRKPEMADIMEAVRAVGHQDRHINDEVILFDINTDNIKRFNPNDYEKIYQH